MYSGPPLPYMTRFSWRLFYFLTRKGISSVWMTVDSMGKDCPLRANALIAG